MAALEAALVAEIRPQTAGKFAGLHLREFAPENTPPVLQLTVLLASDLRICAFRIDGVPEGNNSIEAALAAYRLGLVSGGEGAVPA